MKKRWPVLVAYAFAAVLQLALLGGAWELHVLSRQKMMVMRYLVAKNLELESFWFSPSALLAQGAAFAVLALALVAASLWLWRGRSRAAASQAAAGALLATLGAWLAMGNSAADVRALYALIVAVWAALVIQALVVSVAARRARRAAGEPDRG